MYDLIIIGSGWAGFSAAKYAVKGGLKTLLIEKDKLGGTCLNYGCIPTKTLLNTTKLLSKTKKFSKFGIAISEAKIESSSLYKRVDEVVSQLRQGMEFLVKSNRIDFLQGNAKIISSNEVKVGEEILKTKFILIASGSRPMELPGIKFDGNKIISSTDALKLSKIPDKILIIGAGAIGCEFAEIFVSLGSLVEIVEVALNLLPGVDKETAKKLEMLFRKKEIKVSLSTDANVIDFKNYDKVLLSVGRTPESDCFEKDVVKKDRGKILVNEYLETDVSNIYAAGDCIGGYLLAHAASYEGILAVRNMILGNKEKVNYKAVPLGIFTNPEIATVGLSEEEALKKYNNKIIIKKFDFRSLGISYVIDEMDGFIKIIANEDEDILGASIIGPRATELIHVLTLALNNDMKLSQIKNTIFTHPTISEGIAETLF